MKNFLCLLMLSTFLSCATTADKKNLVLKRAAFDLSCSLEKMTAVEINNSMFGVKGCGKKASYVVECVNPNIDFCKVFLNSKKSKSVK